MALAHIETCPGPAINKVPLRIRFPPEPQQQLPDLDATVAIVHAELIRVMSYEQGGLLAIQKLVPQRTTGPPTSQQQHAGFLLGRFPLDLGIHLQGHLRLNSGARIGMKQLDVRPTSAPPGPFSIECKLHHYGASSELELAVLWDARAANEGDIEKIISCFRDILATEE